MKLTARLTPSPFEVVDKEYRAARQTRRELRDKFDAFSSAVHLADSNADKSGVAPIILRKIEQHVGDRPRSVAQLKRERDELAEQLLGSEPDFAELAHRWQTARAAEARRVLDENRPALEQSARKIGKLVEQLSAEIAAARIVGTKVAELGAVVPDLGVYLGTLGENESALSRWNREMLAHGLLR